MSGEGETVRRDWLADLRTYLEQRQSGGMAWYLDAEAPGNQLVESDAPSAATERPATHPESPAATASAASHAPPPPSPGSPATAKTDDDERAARARERQDRFERECAAFVADTLARIARQREVVPAQTDIFTAAAEEPTAEPLDRAAKEQALAGLAAEVAPCTVCKLHEGRTQTVFGVGNPDAGVVFVGEAPGRDEDLQGEPFVGRAGKLLNEILKAVGFAREDVYICNILKCRPPNNRDPEADEVASCEPYLKQQLALLEPRLIVCLGRVAAQTLLGTRASLTKLRESVHFYESIPVMATYHPAALLRNPHWKRPTWDDVRKMRALHDALAAS